jgi:hypothetical protein
VPSAALLAGFFAAHAIWSVSDGETLVPIYAYYDGSGQRHLDRLTSQPLEVAVEGGKKALAENPHKVSCAVLIYDGYVTISGQKRDALILEIRDYSAAGDSVVMALPYTPKTASATFTVFRPKILKLPENQSSDAFIEDFWRGVDEHKQGSDVWSAHIDQSQ